MKIIFWAYRQWGIDVYPTIERHPRVEKAVFCKTREEVLTLNRFLCVGMHLSDLPMFRGGSRIQHQIIAGLDKTKISLMTISSEGVDVGDIWLKEEWDLSGSTMKDVLGTVNSFAQISP